MHSVRFVLALHNHQPVGNFDGVFESAFADSYQPFLEFLSDYSQIPISLHTSGSLMEWLVEHHPEYIERLKALVARGQVEIIGGGFYEPILPMIPSHDRRGQISHYSRYLEELFECKVRGMWIPERVWEQSLVRDIASAGIEYTVLDDFHFKCAGLSDDQLFGYYLSEDEGQLLKIFPGSERLRYVIPFADPQETIAFARGIGERHPDALLVFADDGEKFGTWPETKKHVYQDGWLRRFFDALVANSDWLKLTTLSQAVDTSPPQGRVYLPDCSYREMTEWALPPDLQVQYEHLAREMEHDERWTRLRRFVRGGFWRNFRVKYAESNDMYCRMFEVSRRLQQMDPDEVCSSDQSGDPVKAEALDVARQELYRGQCNCSYWHGAFGGLYLPHLRNAVYAHLINADTAIEEASGKIGPWIEAGAGDFNLDARQEIRLANDKLVAYVTPSQGGQLYELDIRAVPINLLATLTRRPEAYHEKVLQSAGNPNGQGHAASIHERVVFKQAGLDQKLVYDPYRRRSLIEHFYEPGVTLSDLSSGRAAEQGDFVSGVYESRIRRNPDRVQLWMTRMGKAGDANIRVSKGIGISRESTSLDIAYSLENIPSDFRFLFAVELGFAGLAGNAPDRYFYSSADRNLGTLDAQLALETIDQIGLVDGWLGLDVSINLSRPAGVWTFPVQAVSQSESGFELVHQSSTVIPYWTVQPDQNGHWRVEVTIAADTSRAESKRASALLA
jgi:4-alpha-glucanotransferase